MSAMSGRHFCTILLLQGLAWVPSRHGAAPVAAQAEVVGQADALIRQAREDGQLYLQSKDDRVKKATRKGLEEAEKLLKTGLKRDERCEVCLEHLTTVYFLRTYFGFSKDYDECIRTAEEGLERFPANARMAYTKGAAHYNKEEYGEAIRAFGRYLASKPDDAEARKLLQDSQEHFLSAWYRQADFYNSKDSRIERYQGTQKQTLFQATPDWELSAGGQAVTQLSQAAPELKDPELQAYVEGLVLRITGKTKGPAYDYRVTLLNSPAVNAVTVPGHVFVHSGLLAFVESESELAGVLAHEMGHNYGHHAARRFIKGSEAKMLAASIASAINPKGQVEQLITQLTAQVGVGLLMLSYSRQEEKEADLYGAHLMFNAGYNPTSLSGFFLKMYRSHNKQPVKFLSTHPPDPDRATYLTEYLESFPLDRELQVDSRAFQTMKAKVATLAPGTKGRGILPPPTQEGRLR